VIDVLLVHELTGHLLACEAKSGANVGEAQARKYAALDAHQVVLAGGSVDLPRRTAPTVEPLFACLAPNSARIRLGLERIGVHAAVLAASPHLITLDNPNYAGDLLANALRKPVHLVAGVPRIIPSDQDSPMDVFRPAVRSVLVARLSRRTPQASSAAIAEETAPMLPAYGILGLGAERLVVRNGHHQPREVVTAAGAVPVRAPGVNDKRTDVETGERKRFASAILPAWARKSPQVAEVLPLLCLHGLSSGDFARSHCGLRSITMRVTVVTVAASWL